MVGMTGAGCGSENSPRINAASSSIGISFVYCPFFLNIILQFVQFGYSVINSINLINQFCLCVLRVVAFFVIAGVQQSYILLCALGMIFYLFVNLFLGTRLSNQVITSKRRRARASKKGSGKQLRGPKATVKSVAKLIKEGLQMYLCNTVICTIKEGF